MTNIRNADNFAASWWDWTLFNDCFQPTKIRITDVDGLVERNGHFLLIETKGIGVPVPQGQAILFDAIRRDSRWHVLVVWGDTNQPQRWKVWGYRAEFTGGMDDLRKLIRRWFRYADRAGNRP